MEGPILFIGAVHRLETYPDIIDRGYYDRDKIIMRNQFPIYDHFAIKPVEEGPHVSAECGASYRLAYYPQRLLWPGPLSFVILGQKIRGHAWPANEAVLVTYPYRISHKNLRFAVCLQQGNEPF